ncbi:hypothetical protein Goshw_009612 [Gossypium schwendimanii]|uniref:F-box associated domain-containing protein n=1 Tax=Gossypium schwendimanii TaxID=34291 RepID=A0A7J9MGZ3_GOSSC|nr:hypothetical protein [Gossypium schwendimanii]
MYNDAAFGFDSETDNYKFIRFVTLNFDSEQEISDFHFASQVELYSLKSDSWKEISLPNFDIPQPLEWEDPYRVKLLVLNGSLGAIVYPSTYIVIEPWIAPENYFHFWVMNGEAWTIQFSIESVPEVSHPLEFWKTHELFLTSTNNEIVLLDLSTQELKKLRINTCLDVYAHYISLFAYVESLVLINRRQEYDEHIIRYLVGEE